jgi:hypothetical protein
MPALSRRRYPERHDCLANDAPDGSDPEWTPWFAWYPVTIDVYQPEEVILSPLWGSMLRYRVWMRWVARTFCGSALG